MISPRYQLTPIAFTAVHSISVEAPTEREVEITAVPTTSGITARLTACPK